MSHIKLAGASHIKLAGASHIVIVGASMGGLRAAEQLRAQGFDGRITAIGTEPFMPYNRPPLSKDVLLKSDTGQTTGDWHREVAFRLRPSTADVEWRLGQPVIGSDLPRRTVTLRDGTTIGFDGLVAATGIRPRRLILPGPQAGRHVIRTLGDAIRLRAELRPGARVVVIGGGFIGCEVAASARAMGCSVDIVEPQPTLMTRPLGEALGGTLQRVHEAHGVTVHTRVGIEALISRPTDPDRLSGVLLTDGAALHADVLIEAIGSRPNTEWLAGNDLDLSDGVLCDNHMRAIGATSVVAVGDVARFPSPATGTVARRIEHWCIPTDTAKRAAATLLADLAHRPGDDIPFAPLPSFWSDQHGLRLQGYGSPAEADSVEILEGRLDDLKALPHTVVGYRRAGELIGVVMVSPTPEQNRRYRDVVHESRRTELQPS